MQIHELTKRKIVEADTTGVAGETDGAFGATGFQSGGLVDRLKRTAAAVKQMGGAKAAVKSLGDKVPVPGASSDKKRSAWTNTAALTQSPFMQAYRGGIGSVQPAQPQTAAPATTPAQPVAPQAPAQPISIGGQTLNPNNPAYAQLIAQAQATQQTASQTAQPPRRPAMSPGAGFQTDLGLKGLTRQKAEDVGEYLQRVSGNNTVRNTGNAHVNAMLEMMGFEIK